MNELFLSKSRYCRAKQCMKMFWMDQYMPDKKISKASESVFINGTMVGELAKGLFGKYQDIEYSANKKEMIEQTIKYLENKPNIITEASFTYDNNFCSVDILKNDIDGMEIYEVKSSSDVKDIYLDDASYQYFILSNLGFKIKSVNLVHINKEYVRHGDIEINKLFKIENITEIAKEKQTEIEEKIKELNLFMKNNEKSEPKIDIGHHCQNPYNCDYWEYCTRNLPNPNVFDIAEMHWTKKYEKYYEGKADYKDLLDEDLPEKYKEQVDFEVNNKSPKIDKKSIKEFLDELSYPIYFLDFETFQDAIPQFDNENPYKQIPFQYSLHYIEKEGGELKHKEFLGEAGKDPRRDIAERLVKDIPKDVCVTAYNMGFEKGVIRELAEMYPDLSEHLLNIRENIKDLMVPFFRRYYYEKKLAGSYSIKDVLPTLFPDDPELDYHNLPVVHNGGEASETYLSLVGKTKEEQEKLRQGLLVYCKLDTLAMVKIWEKLKEIVE
ncbi:MAG: DUF2779 domain-containing protein [Clostridia bacterium]|nr:DUF2779 domain-containing protein [Clostridia bacterium]